MSTLNEFFLVALPGLEDLVQAEVTDWFPEFEQKAEYAGVTVFAPLAEGLKMNLSLKTPTRILLRVDKFRVRDFPKLYAKVTDFKWEKWLDPSCQLEVFAATRMSRLKIKTRIEETCTEAWADHQVDRRIKPNPRKKAKLFVRIAEDECTLSLDTSGERLHKRGSRQHIGEAPLRETIAAALLQMMGRQATSEAPVELLDPMAGAGTFLLEAAFRDRTIDSREFAFENFAETPEGEPTLKVERLQFAKLTGYEQDAKTMMAAKHNLASIAAAAPVELIAKDFFKADPLPEPGPNQRWVICNPPYGERLTVKGALDQYYAKLFATVEKTAKPDLACFLLPAKSVKGKFLLPTKWKVLEKRRFLNGGIPVVAFVFGRAQAAGL